MQVFDSGRANMADSEATKSRLQQSISDPASDASEIIKAASSPLQDSMAKLNSNVKTTVDAWKDASLSPLQDAIK